MIYSYSLKHWTLTCLCFVVCLALEGQIPEKMVIWERSNLEVKKATPLYVEFNEQGQKALVYKDRDIPLEVYEYDAKGRILKEVKREKYSNDVVTTYEYRKTSVVIRTTEYNFRKLVTYQYWNDKGQIIEEKQYNNYNGELILKRWKKLKYDERGSLIQERFLPIEDYEKKFPSSSEEVIGYHYRSEDGQLDQITFYEEGKLTGVTHFKYDGEGRVTSERHEEFVYGFAWYYKSYMYKEGKLWQTCFLNIYEKEEKIYLDGQLVRVKRYDNSQLDPELTYVGDYQYLED